MHAHTKFAAQLAASLEQIPQEREPGQHRRATDRPARICPNWDCHGLDGVVLSAQGKTVVSSPRPVKIVVPLTQLCNLVLGLRSCSPGLYLPVFKDGGPGDVRGDIVGHVAQLPQALSTNSRGADFIAIFAVIAHDRVDQSGIYHSAVYLLRHAARTPPVPVRSESRSAPRQSRIAPAPRTVRVNRKPVGQVLRHKAGNARVRGSRPRSAGDMHW